jgi:hypothetical protein
MKAVVRHDTGKVKHWLGKIEDGEVRKGAPIAGISSLEIVERNGSFFLLRMNAEDECLTDSWHQTKQEAILQAEFEFDVRPEDWS